MYNMISWVLDRLKCTFKGHQMRSQRIFYGPAKSTIPGYRCKRCGRDQLFLNRWQKDHGKSDEE
jgi:hypothetical protein